MIPFHKNAAAIGRSERRSFRDSACRFLNHVRVLRSNSRYGKDATEHFLR